MVSFSGDLSGNIDLDLARIGRARRVVLAVPQFSGLRALLAVPTGGREGLARIGPVWFPNVVMVARCVVLAE